MSKPTCRFGSRATQEPWRQCHQLATHGPQKPLGGSIEPVWCCKHAGEFDVPAEVESPK